MSDYRGDNGSPHFDRKAFVEDVEKLGTIKKFTCFFDSANFLMTHYYPLTDNIHAIFEFESGDTLQFQNMLCGYGGHGPSNTTQALMCLGIPKDEADWYCRSSLRRGIQLELEPSKEKNYQVKDKDFHCWFDPYAQNNLISDGDFFVSLLRRIVIVTNPEEKLDDLWRLIRCCDPFSMDYSIDAKEPLYFERELLDSGILAEWKSNGRTNINVVIKGEAFSIYICFSKETLFSMLNAISFTFSGRVLFYAHQLWRFRFLSDRPIRRMSVSEACRLLHKGSFEKTYGSLQIRAHKEEY